MDNNYKEIRERTSEKLGYVVHRVNRTHLLFVSREKKRKESKNNYYT